MFLRNRLSREARNTYIGGVSGTINTPELLAVPLGIDAMSIKNFEVDGDDISCYISNDYNMSDGGFQGEPITYYIDLGGRLIEFGNRRFAGTNSLELVIANKARVLSIDVFLQSRIDVLSIISSNPIGSNSAYNGVFREMIDPLLVYANIATATNNGGQPDGDLQYVTDTLGGTVKYNTNQTSAQAITDLSVDSTTSNSVTLTWSEPINTNGIDYYLVFRDNVFVGYTDLTTYEVTGLTEETEYNFRVISLDSQGNTSEFSNVVVGETTEYIPTEIPLSAYVNYWKYDGDVLDHIGNNDGTPTDITFVQGIVNNCASLNGSSSVIKFNGYNTGFDGVSFSVAQWFKTSQTSPFRLLQNRGQGSIGSTKGWQISYTSGGAWSNIFLENWSGDYLSMDNIPYNENDNQWHHLVVTWNTLTGTCEVYIDGIYKGSKTNILMVNSNLNGLDVLDGGSNTNGQLLEGLLDESAIFNKVLTQEEVTFAYEKGLAGESLL